MARKYTVCSKEEKLSLVKRNLSGEAAIVIAREIGCSDRQIRNWVKIYQAEGEAGLEQKKKPGNPLSRYERSVSAGREPPGGHFRPTRTEEKNSLTRSNCSIRLNY